MQCSCEYVHVLQMAHLCEVESRHPEHNWLVVVHPFLQELESGQQVINVATQWLEGGVRTLGPELRNLKNE